MEQVHEICALYNYTVFVGWVVAMTAGGAPNVVWRYEWRLGLSRRVLYELYLTRALHICV